MKKINLRKIIKEELEKIVEERSSESYVITLTKNEFNNPKLAQLKKYAKDKHNALFLLRRRPAEKIDVYLRNRPAGTPTGTYNYWSYNDIILKTKDIQNYANRLFNKKIAENTSSNFNLKTEESCFRIREYTDGGLSDRGHVVGYSWGVDENYAIHNYLNKEQRPLSEAGFFRGEVCDINKETKFLTKELNRIREMIKNLNQI